MTRLCLLCGLLVCLLFVMPPLPAQTVAAGVAEPLVIGESFPVVSRILGETRRINVWRPPSWAVPASGALPVIYMPDGGIAEDFQHVAGLLQVLIGNGGMRPFLLVGIENTQRRRDLTGPTSAESDRTIAPVVGGSAVFRAFLRDELKPIVAQRYKVTGESAIMGESLAGLFVLETLVLEPALFDHFIAFDPSVWWNAEWLTGQVTAKLGAWTGPCRTLAVVASNEPSQVEPIGRLRTALVSLDTARVRWQLSTMSQESHATIYHPAALVTLRALFAPRDVRRKERAGCPGSDHTTRY